MMRREERREEEEEEEWPSQPVVAPLLLDAEPHPVTRTLPTYPAGLAPPICTPPDFPPPPVYTGSGGYPPKGPGSWPCRMGA